MNMKQKEHLRAHPPTVTYLTLLEVTPRPPKPPQQHHQLGTGCESTEAYGGGIPTVTITANHVVSITTRSYLTVG